MNDASFSKLMMRQPCSGGVVLSCLGHRVGGLRILYFPLLACGLDLFLLLPMFTVELIVVCVVFMLLLPCACTVMLFYVLQY